jgi:glycosyltransferase involved in cell wall biosynthesis
MTQGLVVIPTYNCRGEVIPEHLLSVLLAMLEQSVVIDIDIVVVDTLSSPEFCDFFREWLRERKIKFIHVDFPLPVFHAFNLAVSMAVRDHNWIAYCSDDTVLSKNSDLEIITSCFVDKSIGIVSGMVNHDHCPFFYPHYKDTDVSPKPIVLGENVNLHLMVFSKEFMKHYDYRYTDIFTGWGTETLFPFLCAAIGKKWVVCNEVLLINHKTESLQTKNKKKGKQGNGYGVFGNLRSFAEILKPGIEYGIGFEEWRSKKFEVKDPDLMRKLNQLRRRNKKPDFWCEFDRSCYDAEFKCKKQSCLYSYMISNLFLKESELNYKSMADKVVAWL